MRFLKQIMAAVSAVILGTAAAAAQGLIRDTEIERVLRNYADPLIVAAGLEPDSVDMYLVNDIGFNAFVSGGQNVFMNTGAIIIAEDPIEIKGVLAHEIGHISGAHLARFGDAQRSALATMIATMGLGIAAALAGEGAAGAAIMASSQQFAQLDMLSYSRAQEAAADQAALQFLDATGQSGNGLVTTFERFRYQEVMSNQRRMAYFRSHPLSSERIAALRVGVAESDFAEVTDTEEEVRELRRIQAKIIGFMVPPAQTFSRYPETDTSIPARYARATAYYKRGSVDRAREVIQTLIAEEPDNPYFYELEGQILYESGFLEESIAPYRQAVQLMPDAPLIRIGLASALIADGTTDGVEEARIHLLRALTDEENNPYGWYQLSLAYQAQDNIAMAELATAERYFWSGDRIQAYQFASRAQEDLQEGTPGYIRAAQLRAITQPTPREISRANRAERERRNVIPHFELN